MQDREEFIEMFSQEPVKYIGDETHACPSCGKETRDWEKNWYLGRDGEEYLPEEYAAEAPSDLCCPECWIDKAADIQEALAAEEYEEHRGRLDREYELGAADRVREATERAARPINETVWIQRQWDDWKEARVRLEDLSGFHWGDISGGVQAVAPRSFIHAYVLCSDFIEGEVAHSCRHGRGPHKIKVCITKSGNEATFSKIKALAGEK